MPPFITKISRSIWSIFWFAVCIDFAADIPAAYAGCDKQHMPASTPDIQLRDNGNGTITDLKTNLMWKKCLEGVSGYSCTAGTATGFTWQEALKKPGLINSSGGFAGHQDWRLPNIKELISIAETQCINPAINLTRFPNTPSEEVWSSSPYAGTSGMSWYLAFYWGISRVYYQNNYYNVRLVRGGE